MAAAFDVVIFGDGRQHGRVLAELLRVAQDNLCPIVVLFDSSFDRNDVALELADITEVIDVRREHDHSERTSPVVRAKIQERNTIAAVFDAYDVTGDTMGLAYVLVSVDDAEAILGSVIGKANRGGEEDDPQEEKLNWPAHRAQAELPQL